MSADCIEQGSLEVSGMRTRENHSVKWGLHSPAGSPTECPGAAVTAFGFPWGPTLSSPFGTHGKRIEAIRSACRIPPSHQQKTKH